MNAQFVPPMLLLHAEKLPKGEQWAYELKLDRYRAIAFKSSVASICDRETTMISAERYPAILGGLANLPDETVIGQPSSSCSMSWFSLPCA